MFDLRGNLALQIFGAAFILAWAMGVFWNWRSWYWRSQRAIYSYLPMGLLFILASFQEQIMTSLSLNMWGMRVIYIVFIAIGVWWTVRPPAFLKPWWAKEIESYPPAVYSALKRDVSKDRDWPSHFKDRDALQKWIKKVGKGTGKPRK